MVKSLISQTRFRRQAGSAAQRRAAARLLAPDELLLAELIARQTGRDDGRAGHRLHAPLYPNGAPGHADYELGQQDSELERDYGIKPLDVEQIQFSTEQNSGAATTPASAIAGSKVSTPGPLLPRPGSHTKRK